MHFTICLFAISYDGNQYLTVNTNQVVRSDNISNIGSFNSVIDVGSGLVPDFEYNNSQAIYKRIADDIYTQYCSTYSLSPDPVTYIFLGLSIIGPFIYSEPKFIQKK